MNGTGWHSKNQAVVSPSGRTRLLVLLILLGSVWTVLGWAVTGRAGPNLPEVDRLPVIEGLPDPLVFQDGTQVKNRADWLRRRAEIVALIQYYEYGHLPPAPRNVVAETISSEPILDGAATEKRLLMSMGPGRQIGVHVRMLIPRHRSVSLGKAQAGVPPSAGSREASRPFPVIIINDNHQNGHTPIDRELIERGYVLAIYNRTDLAPDKENDPQRPPGSARLAYPQYDWATLAIWAWGGMRVLDYLETLDWIDPAKVVITGHSRGGKVALLAGALDERFALVVPNGSGCGGTGSFRVRGERCETLELITDPKRFSYWFHPRLRTFAGQVNRLPLDQHYLRALVAPRGLLSTDALGDAWGNPLGTQATFEAAQGVFDLLGAGDRQGQHFRPGGHDQLAEDWRALADFADRLFFAKPTERDFKQAPLDTAKAASR